MEIAAMKKVEDYSQGDDTDRKLLDRNMATFLCFPKVPLNQVVGNSFPK